VYPEGYLEGVADQLCGAQLKSSDFDVVLQQAGDGDFVYVDPPYTVLHNNNGFIKYNQVLFSWEDQVRLATAVSAAVQRGAMVFVSNADHGPVRELYRSLPFHFTLARSSILSATATARRMTSEAAFLSYDPKATRDGAMPRAAESRGRVPVIG
jgi:DNA adenine methylase